jgi:probable F420-dependent oxidoreductase
MKFGVTLAYNDPAELAELARAAEQAGFGAMVVSDHLVHPEKLSSRYPYTENGEPRWPPFTPWPDPFVAIGFMAAVTRRIRFITNVFVLPTRNPFLVAKTVGTAAIMSGNRVTLGVGLGWMREEFDLVGQPFRGRGRRAEEMLEVMRKLWAGGMVEHHGEHYDFERLEMSPVPSEPIPIYVGGTSEPALRRAARIGQGWSSELHTTEELRKMVAKLSAYRRDSPLAGEPLDICASVSDAYVLDHYRQLDEIGVSYLFTVPWMMYPGAAESLERKRDAIRRFGDEVVAQMR